MNRLALFVYATMAAGPVLAQQNVSTHIYTQPAGARFRVDGLEYTTAATFLWPAGSKHILEMPPVQLGATSSIRYSFNGWTDSTSNFTSSSPVVAITADAAITNIKAIVNLEYAITLSFFACESGPFCALGPGSVFVGGTPYTHDTLVWAQAESVVAISATPNPGFVFAGWNADMGSPSAFARNVVMRGPVTLSPRFSPAKRVSIRTVAWRDGEPLELEVLVDRQPVRAPITLDLAENTEHVLAANSPQLDRFGRYWVFDSFDTGTGGINSTYTAVGTNIPATITARFVPAVTVSFLTEPAGLRLKVDGRDNWASYNFVWGLNSKHTVIAPAETTDSRGRKYVFKGWSNGAPAEQELAISTEMTDGVRLIASYELLSRVSIITTPPGLALEVDGAACKTPCNIDRPRGGTARVIAPSSLPVTATTRMEFAGWADGAEAERVFQFDRDLQSVSATYRTAVLLTAVADPSDASAFKMEPASNDGFYPEGTTVMLTAEAIPGYRFRRWEGDLNGTFRSAYLNMTAPRVARAVFDRVPHILPAGVRNAAAELPEAGVAAGSLISILGVNLAPGLEVGPLNPLSQALSGVTARIGNRLLPLLSVSPEMINAQLPWDLEEGSYTLAVRWSGQPEVSADFALVRNAPGLFTRAVDGKNFVSANHEDGSPVTLESPARRGEWVTLLGTGFGPLDRRPPDGFPVPQAPSYVSADRIELLAGELPIEPEWSGAVSGQVGLIGVRFKISDELPGASTVELKARVNGRDSNTVLLPIE